MTSEMPEPPGFISQPLLEVAPDDPAGLLGMSVCPAVAGGIRPARVAFWIACSPGEPGQPGGCLEYAALEADAGRPV